MEHPGFRLMVLGVSLLLSLAEPRLIGQTPAPLLHHRADSEAVDAADSITISKGRTTLPPDVSGAYSLGEKGELVEIDLQPDQLTGYVSRLGDKLSDEGTPLTFFFSSSSLNGRELSFTTRQVHGVWFSFTGTIVRGSTAIRSQDGYYRLEGRLVLHDSANGTEQAREVSLPQERQYSAGSS